MALSVFISYSHSDSALETRLRQKLIAQGITVWVDHESLRPGTPDWEAAIRQGIRAATVIVTLASPEAHRSVYVKGELELAQYYKKHIIPVLIAGDWHAVAPLNLIMTQYTDGRGQRFEQAIDEIMRTLLPNAVRPAPMARPTPPPQPDVVPQYMPPSVPVLPTLQAQPHRASQSFLAPAMPRTQKPSVAYSTVALAILVVVVLVVLAIKAPHGGQNGSSIDSINSTSTSISISTSLSTNTSISTSTSPTGNTGAARGCTKIGISLPESASFARWESKDSPLLQQKITNALPGVHIDILNAEGDNATQKSQVEGFLAKGDCILVIAAHDSTAAATLVDEAHAAHVPVIAYDRPINSTTLDYYVSIDNVSVGVAQGNYIQQHYQQYVTANGNNNIYFIDGSSTDPAATLFSQGVHRVVDTLISSRSLIKVYENFTPNWDNPTAQTEMEQALTANQNKIAIAYVANDGMAGTVIQALTAQHLNQKVLVTGQDATTAGLQQILLGNQTMTVYKSISSMADGVAQLIAALSKGQNTGSIASGTFAYSGTNIPSVLVKGITVDISNIASTVLADQYVNKADLCNGIPSGRYGSGTGAVTCP